jgi:DedD protein
MEKKTTQRIIGILVVAALVIILLPLMFGKNDMTADVASNQSSDQQMNPSDVIQTETPKTVAQNDTTAATPATETHPTDTRAEATDVTVTPQTTAEDINHQSQLPVPEQLAQAAPAPKTPEAVATPEAAAPTVAENNVAPVTPATPAPAPEQKEQVAVVEKPAAVTEPPIASPVKAVAEKKSAKKSLAANSKHAPAKFKTTAWVIQMGSFKDKDNARRLADKLRAAGYKAFTREIKASTRVFIGPESKQASALKLSNEVEQQFKLHGIVMTFKPLEI